MIEFRLSWARAVTYPICATLKIPSLKQRTSDGCRRRQLSIKLANPSRRTFKMSSSRKKGETTTTTTDVIYGLEVPRIFCFYTSPTPVLVCFCFLFPSYSSASVLVPLSFYSSLSALSSPFTFRGIARSFVFVEQLFRSHYRECDDGKICRASHPLN